MNKFIAAALLAAPLMALAEPANLVVNGSFESTAISNNSWTIVNSLSGWTTGSRGIELRNNAVGTALEGRNFAELDTTGNSSISQSINTVSGQWYSLSFYYSNRIDVAQASNGLGWSFGSASGSTTTPAQIGGSHQWQLFSTQVLGTGAPMTLSFTALGSSDSLGTSLDRISVTAVPEPQTYALMLAGLAAVGFMAKRRKLKP